MKNSQHKYLSNKVVNQTYVKSIEPFVVLKVGDIVRIKDKKWFDSIEHNNVGNGLVKDGKYYLAITARMQECLGEVVKIRKVAFNPNTKSPRYYVELVNRTDSNYLDGYAFCNDTLEYL